MTLAQIAHRYRGADVRRLGIALGSKIGPRVAREVRQDAVKFLDADILTPAYICALGVEDPGMSGRCACAVRPANGWSSIHERSIQGVR